MKKLNNGLKKLRELCSAELFLFIHKWLFEIPLALAKHADIFHLSMLTVTLHFFFIEICRLFYRVAAGTYERQLLTFEEGRAIRIIAVILAAGINQPIDHGLDRRRR